MIIYYMCSTLLNSMCFKSMIIYPLQSNFYNRFYIFVFGLFIDDLDPKYHPTSVRIFIFAFCHRYRECPHMLTNIRWYWYAGLPFSLNILSELTLYIKFWRNDKPKSFLCLRCYPNRIKLKKTRRVIRLREYTLKNFIYKSL